VKIRVGALRRLVERALTAKDPSRLLRDLREAADEAESDAEQQSAEKSADGTSIDVQIDRYLIQYEKAAGKQAAVESREMIRGFMLREADDDAEDKETQLPADVGSSKKGSVDVETFASSVARLVESFDSLIETRRTIVKRAADFLRKTHDDDVVDAFVDSMRDQHGIDPDETAYESDVEIEAPPAVGAGVPAGGGI
jgi:hypothetical protein